MSLYNDKDTLAILDKFSLVYKSQTRLIFKIAMPIDS